MNNTFEGSNLKGIKSLLGSEAITWMSDPSSVLICNYRVAAPLFSFVRLGKRFQKSQRSYLISMKFCIIWWGVPIIIYPSCPLFTFTLVIFLGLQKLPLYKQSRITQDRIYEWPIGFHRKDSNWMNGEVILWYKPRVSVSSENQLTTWCTCGLGWIQIQPI